MKEDTPETTLADTETPSQVTIFENLGLNLSAVFDSRNFLFILDRNPFHSILSIIVSMMIMRRRRRATTVSPQTMRKIRKKSPPAKLSKMKWEKSPGRRFGKVAAPTRHKNGAYLP